MKQIYTLITSLLLFVGLPSVINAQANTDSTPVEKETLIVLEMMPEFPGGEEAYLKYLIDHVVYPEEAYKNGITGTVLLSFIVETDGSITDIKVLRSAHKLLDDEAIRVAKLMPAWKPGMQRGKVVRAMHRMPVRFVLD